MQSAQLKVVGGVVVVGLLAALPFARLEQPTPSPNAQPEAASPGLQSVPLYLPAETSSSPAVGLRDHDPPPAAPPIVAVAAASGHSHLEDNGIPPAMPDQYQPLLENPRPVEPRVLHVEQSPPQVRTHRVVDGDTLARLAQRYWQDASLADALYAANKAVLASPDELPIGVVLSIPAKPAKARMTISPQEPQAELLPAPVRQPTTEVELDEPLVPINR